MNEAHVQEWVDALRSDAYPQTRETLKGLVDPGSDDDVVGFCCLGVGCEVARIPEDPSGGYGEAGADVLPPIEFLYWLGISEPKHKTNHTDDPSFSVYLDAPADIVMREQVRQADKGVLRLVSLADLNDELRLTFPQIGDLIAYFGVWA